MSDRLTPEREAELAVFAGGGIPETVHSRDIVADLRRVAVKCYAAFAGLDATTCRLYDEAADEIDTLRAERHQLGTLASEYHALALDLRDQQAMPDTSIDLRLDRLRRRLLGTLPGGTDA